MTEFNSIIQFSIYIQTRVDPLTSILAVLARFLLRSYQNVSLSQDRILLRLKKFQDFKISIKIAENSYIVFCPFIDFLMNEIGEDLTKISMEGQPEKTAVV